MDLTVKMIEQFQKLYITFKFRTSANDEVTIERNSICLNGLSLYLSYVKTGESRVFEGRLSLC